MLKNIYPYGVLFFLNFFEGSVITFGAGASINVTGLNPVFVFITLLIADVVSDLVYYAVGRLSSGIIHSKYMKIFGITPARVMTVGKYYRTHGPAALFVAKMSDVFAMPAIILAGALKMPLTKYIPISVGTALVKACLLLTAGYFLSGYIKGPYFVYALSGCFILVAVGLIFRHYYRKMKFDTDGTP